MTEESELERGREAKDRNRSVSYLLRNEMVLQGRKYMKFSWHHATDLEEIERERRRERERGMEKE